VYRMLYSQGVFTQQTLRQLRIGTSGMTMGPPDNPRELWRIFAGSYHLFQATPTRLWLDFVFEKLFGLETRLSDATADHYYDVIAAKLATPAFLPRALYTHAGIEVLATTDSALDTLDAHRALRNSGWTGRVIPTFRPDACLDPEFAGFSDNLAKLGDRYGEDTTTWAGYLAALRAARAFFQLNGATATDHGFASPRTAALSTPQAEALFARVLKPSVTAEDADLFRAQMLTEMARMSLDDGLIMQIHPGSYRNHNATISPPRLTMCTRSSRCWTSSATRQGSPSSCSRWTKQATAASWRRSPGTTHVCGLGRPGGSTTARKACCASASRLLKLQVFTTRLASTTTHERSFPSPLGMTSPDVSTAHFWRNSWQNTDWTKTKQHIWRLN
jgi:hypothetical protein